MKLVFISILISLFSFNDLISQSTYTIKKKWDGSYEVKDKYAASKALIQGAYRSAPKFQSYKIDTRPHNVKSYSKNTRSSSNQNINNYIIILNQSEKNYSNKDNSNISIEKKKPEIDKKQDYKYIKTYKVKTRAQIEKERIENLKKFDKNIDIIYEFDFKTLNEKKIDKFFIYSGSKKYWDELSGLSTVYSTNFGRMINRSTTEENKNIVNSFFNAIIEYSDFTKENIKSSLDFELSDMINEINDKESEENLNKLSYQLKSKYPWFNIKDNCYSKRCNKAREIYNQINNLKADIRDKWHSKFSHLKIEYHYGFIGNHLLPCHYIKIKQSDGRVLYEALYKNYTLIELIEELFVI